MRLIFAGTPEFSATILSAIVASGHQVALALTQPDRPRGRGMTLDASAVKKAASAAGIEVFQPPSLRDPAVHERLRAVDAEAMIVAAYGLILPQQVLELPRFGCINVHASLLPRWRGAAPIQRAILAGDDETGVCIMHMDTGLDTGPILLSERLPIASSETASTLHDKLSALGARLIIEAIGSLPMPSRAQPESGVTYAGKIQKSEAPLDWRLPAAQLDRQIRAFNPFPGATVSLQGNTYKVWRSATLDIPGSQPGTVIAADRHGILVACAEGALRLLELQKAGGRRMSAEQFIAGTPIAPGAVFDSLL